MSRAGREPPSPSSLAPALLRLVAAHGRDADELAARCGVPDDAAARDEIAIEPGVVNALLESAADLLGEPALALRLPADLPQRRYDPLELVIRAATTLGDALAQVARYAALVHPQLAFELVGSGELAEWHQRTPGQLRGIGRHAHDYGLAFVLTHVRAALAAPLVIERVWFAHARPRELAPIEQFFGTRALEFGAVDSGLAFAAAQLAAPLATRDPRLAATAADLADAALQAAPRSTAFAPRVVAAIRARLPDEVTAGALAAELHVSPRTLQRRLEDEATSVTALLDATREQLARAWLPDRELALAEIAYRLGFADLAAFSRAFKRWTGQPPGRYRHRP